MDFTFLTSGFSDEAGATIDEQITAIQQAELGGLDLRSIENINVLSLTDETLQSLKDRCATSNVRIQSIGSPINKVKFAEDTFAKEMEKLTRAIHAANFLETKRIRIFTPEVEKSEFQTKSEGILELMSEMIALAKLSDIILIHENDGTFFGAFPENAQLMFEKLGCGHFKAAFDFGNAVMIGLDPFRDWFPWLLPHLDTLHMKDATESPLQFVACGEGDSKMVETISWLISQSWNGCLTLEPHLKAAGPLGGFSGPELFNYAAKCMKNVLIESGGTPESPNF